MDMDIDFLIGFALAGIFVAFVCAGAAAILVLLLRFLPGKAGNFFKKEWVLMQVIAVTAITGFILGVWS